MQSCKYLDHDVCIFGCANNADWGSRMFKRLVRSARTRSKKKRVSPGQQRLPWDWDVRLNQIPDEWHQVAVKSPNDATRVALRLLDKLVKEGLAFDRRVSTGKAKRREFWAVDQLLRETG